MSTAFHYTVKIKLFNYHNKDKVELIEHEQEFINPNPIEARKDAFRFYQNWVDILLETMGKDYNSDRETRENLKAFLVPNNSPNLSLGKKDIDLSYTLSFGIGVYFIIDIPSVPLYKNDKGNDQKGDENLIHGIGNSSKFNDPASFAFHLDNELNYYRNNNYEVNGLVRYTAYYDWMMADVEEIEYLETPFDWTGLEDPEHPLLNLIETIDYSSIIENGEGEGVEFKPSLNYHFTNRTWEGKQEVNYIIAKALCAFLNSKEGGILFIGVKDNGDIQGLDFDFKLSQKENKKDYFKLEFDRVIKKYFGFSVKALIKGEFTKINDQIIFVIEVDPSTKRPIFLINNEGQKEFWVRGSASNEQLTDIQEIIYYWLDKQQKQ